MKQRYSLNILKVFIFILFLSAGVSVTGLTSDVAAAKSSKQSVVLNYDGEAHTYKGVQGHIIFNHKEITLSTMPIVKIDGVLYVPAQELLQTVFGYSWKYNEENGFYSAYDEDMLTEVTFKAEEYTLFLTVKGEQSTIDISNPIRMIGMGDAPAVVCVPLKKLVTILNMNYSWDSKKQICTIQRLHCFDLEGTVTEEDPNANHILHTTADYQINDNMASFDMHFYGDLQASFDGVSINRNAETITAVLPNTVFLPSIRLYDRFGEIIDRMVISEADGNVTITFYCAQTSEFAYTTTDNDLYIRIIWDYSNTEGISNDNTLTFMRPSNDYLVDNITLEDLYDAVYHKKVFKIILKGDHEEFLNNNPIVINDDSVKKIDISVTSSNNTVIKVKTKSLRACKVYRDTEKFIIKIGAPHKLYKNVLVLDAGHGDHDNGTTNYGTKEKDMNLRMIYTLMKKHFNSPCGDVKVYWTRRDDSFVTLDSRAAFAKKIHADAFISLHMNAASNKSAAGTEVYYSTSNNGVTSSGLRSSIMAEMMLDELVWNMDTEERGVKTANFVVIYKNTVPAILIELGFLSNKKDHEKITSTKYQKIASKTIADVIKNIFTEYPSR